MTVPTTLDDRFRTRAAAEGILDVAFDVTDSPLGPLLVAATERGVCRISYDPDADAELEALAARGVRDVLVCPVGFVSDHLEVLYDLDVEAKAAADRAGLAFGRTAVVNDDPAVMAALAERIVAACS